MLLAVPETSTKHMKAKLLKEQMGVPAGTEMKVLETGRAWTLRAPSGAEIVVPACDVEGVPFEVSVTDHQEPEVDLGSTMEYGTGSGYLPPPEPEVDPEKPFLLVTDEYQELLDEQRNSEVDPKDPGLLVNILGGQPEPTEEPKPAKKKVAKKKAADD